MAEKVIITEEQANALENFRNKYDSASLVGSHIIDSFNKEDGCQSLAKSRISTDDLIRALYIDYEVLSITLKEGDKLIYPKVSSIGTVEGNMVYWDDNAETELDYTIKLMESGELRMATEEDIFWLEEMNRNSVPDFRKHDIYVDNNMDTWLLGKDITVDKAHEIYQDGDFLGVYPTDSFKTSYK